LSMLNRYGRSVIAEQIVHGSNFVLLILQTSRWRGDPVIL
jgi:hypothetical protein